MTEKQVDLILADGTLGGLTDGSPACSVHLNYASPVATTAAPPFELSLADDSDGHLSRVDLGSPIASIVLVKSQRADIGYGRA